METGTRLSLPVLRDPVGSDVVESEWNLNEEGSILGGHSSEEGETTSSFPIKTGVKR